MTHSSYHRLSDEYDPEPDYDRPTRAEAEADARLDRQPRFPARRTEDPKLRELLDSTYAAWQARQPQVDPAELELPF